MCQTDIPHRDHSFVPLLRRKSRRKTGTQQAMTTVMVFVCYWSDETAAVETFLQERSKEFDTRFSRCYGVLHFLACRILGSSDGVEEAIENCRAKASQNPPDFEQEGAFRSWLVRILMDEALGARGKRHID